MFLLASLLLTGMVIGQRQNPITWNFEAKKKNAVTYDIILTATIDNPWHIYSQNTDKGGADPTIINFKPNPLVVKNGIIKEIGKLKKTYEKLFGANVLFYTEKVQFVQTVKVKNGIKTTINGMIQYSVCDDNTCMPPAKKLFDLVLL